MGSLVFELLFYFKRLSNHVIKRTVGACAIILNSSVVLIGHVAAAYLYRCIA